jgi:hypothetical protein
MHDVAGVMLGDFARRFKEHLTAPQPTDAGGGAPSDAAPPAAEQEEALDLGSVMTQMPIVRYGAPVAAGVVLVAALVGMKRARRRRGLSVRFGVGF